MSTCQNGDVGSTLSTAPHHLPACQQAVVLYAWSLLMHLSAFDQPFSAFALYLSCIAVDPKALGASSESHLQLYRFAGLPDSACRSAG